jgi:hypothetical protein
MMLQAATAESRSRSRAVRIADAPNTIAKKKEPSAARKARCSAHASRGRGRASTVPVQPRAVGPGIRGARMTIEAIMATSFKEMRCFTLSLQERVRLIRPGASFPSS